MFNAAIENATFSIPPGEEVNVLLRLIEENPQVTKLMQNGEVFDLLEFANETGGGVTSQQVNTSDAEAGIKIPRAAATKLLLGTAALPDGSVGVGYTGYVDAVGGDSTSYTYWLNSGELPPVLDLSTGYNSVYPYPRGIISGNPTTAGTYHFVVQVSDGSETDNQAYKITIHEGAVPDTPTITTPSPLPNAIQGVYYGVGLTASGGQLPYIWTLEPGSSLPDDLSLDQGGAITGKPEAPVTVYNFTVKVMDQDGDHDTKEFSLEIRESTGTYVTISGTVYDSGGQALNDVVIRGLPNTPITGAGDWADGYYEDSVPSGWEGTARPFKIDHTFDPLTREYTYDDTKPPVTTIPGQDYNSVPPAGMYTISGVVNFSEGGLENVVMSGFPGTVTVITDPDGEYTTTVDHGWSGTVTPTLGGYDFDPVSRTYFDVHSDYIEQDYTASLKEEWAARYNGLGSKLDRANAMTSDSSGNIYVTGFSTEAGTGGDCLTIKYDHSLAKVWVARYAGGGNSTDNGIAIAVDSSGEVYVLAYSRQSENDHNEATDYVTIKYDSNGNKIWDYPYDHGEYDMPSAIAVDADNVYVTGFSDSAPGPTETNLDYATVAYDKVNGQPLWNPTGSGEIAARYDGGNGNDYGVAIAVDDSGVYVTGYSYGGDPAGEGTGFDYATIGYNKSTGVPLWTAARYNGPADRFDRATSIAADPNGIYVTGYSYGGDPADEGTDYDYATIKYDTSGNEIWVTRFHGSHLSSPSVTLRPDLLYNTELPSRQFCREYLEQTLSHRHRMYEQRCQRL